MLRSFLPVGQGAFYLEQFNDSVGNRINVVYDCGSLIDVKLVEKEIKATFSENKEIEIVFISHVDQDHINGLEYLLNYCKVKNIVFPYTKKEDRILLTISYLCENRNPSNNDFTYKFIKDPRFPVNQLSSNTRLWGISDEPIKNGNESITILKSGENIYKRVLDSTIIPKIDWEYVPYNFRENNRREQFISKLKNNLEKISFSWDKINLDNIWEYWKISDVKNAIIDAYKKVDGSLNTNSMTLFSGTRDNNVHQRLINPYNRSYCCPACIDCYDYYFRINGCLYTGDYEANGKNKWEALEKAYLKYWDYIGCVQIPHHGSWKNYNPKFALIDAYFVISAGLNNKFRHPSGSVIKNLLLNGKHPLIVTEQCNSEVILEIDI